MTGEELTSTLKRLGLTTLAFAQHIERNEKTVRRWRKGTTPIPRWIEREINDLSQSQSA